MAKSVRSRRTAIAAGALSLALVAPFVSPVQAQETTTPTSEAEPAPAEQPSTSEGTTAATFEQRFDTANFWNADEAVVEGLQLQPGDTVAPRANTIFNWGFNNNDGTLTLIRPKSTAAFGAGKKDIPVRVTTAAGETFDTTLRVNIIDERPGAEWESQLTSRYPMDFGKSTSAQSVEGITLPEGVSVSKSGAALPTGWTVSNDGTTVRVTPPTTFKEGDFDLPIKVNDGTDKFEATLKIAAKNPSKTPAETAGTVAGIIGSLFGGGTGGGEGGTSGGAGRLINIVVTNNANPSNIGNNNGSPNVVVTDNVNPRDNLSNNGSNNSAVVTNNANPVVTGNANPTVVITGNANDNGSNNSAVVTNNANPVVTGNANDNGSNNSAVVTNNANDNLRDAGSNNSVVVTGNANPEVLVTGNANGGLLGIGSSRKREGQNGDSLINANVGVDGGSSDPRCIASLVGLGLPLIAMIPLALAGQVNVPGLSDIAERAERAFNDAARQFNIEPAQLTAAGGAAVGVVAALILTAAVRTCIPSVNGVDVSIGGSSNGNDKPPATVAAPVVETRQS